MTIHLRLQEWFSNLKLLTKMILAYALVLMVFLAQGTMGLRGTSDVGDLAMDIYMENLLPLDRINMVTTAVYDYRMLLFRHLGESSAEQMTVARSMAETRASDVADLLQTPDIAGALEGRGFNDAWTAMTVMGEDIMFNAENFATEEAFATINGEASDQFNLVKDILDATVNDLRLEAEDGFMRASDTVDSAMFAGPLLLGLGVLLAGVIVFIVTRSITKPISSITCIMTKLANQELDVDVSGRELRNEIGDIGRAVQVFKENALENVRLQEQAEEQRQAQRLEEQARAQEKEAEAKAREAEQKARNEEILKRQEHKDCMTKEFEGDINDIIQGLGSSVNTLTDSADRVSNATEQAIHLVSGVSDASQDVTESAQAIAGAVEELSSSVAEISQQIGHTNEITTQAVNEAEGANKIMTEMSAAAEQINLITGLISDIAEQTNLLALNATIEAARAGDAGRGFAVVASEVKSLATQTAKATEDISKYVTGVVGATDRATDAIGKINSTITQVDQITTMIAGAVEEQNASTQEIARNVQNAAERTVQMNSDVEEVRVTTSENGAVVDALGTAIDGLTNQSGTLRSKVQNFLGEVQSV